MEKRYADILFVVYYDMIQLLSFQFTVLPIFPEDFHWSSNGAPHGYNCEQINEPSDPHSWDDNYLCWKNTKKDPGLRWRYGGAKSNMKCTKIYEDDDPHAWRDNFLCVPNDSPYNFVWSQNGTVGNHCLQIIETADPNGWSDNYLCLQ